MRQHSKSKHAVGMMCDVEPICRCKLVDVGAAFRYPSAYAVGFWKTSPCRGCDVMQLVEYIPTTFAPFARVSCRSVVIDLVDGKEEIIRGGPVGDVTVKVGQGQLLDSGGRHQAGSQLKPTVTEHPHDV